MRIVLPFAALLAMPAAYFYGQAPVSVEVYRPMPEIRLSAGGGCAVTALGPCALVESGDFLMLSLPAGGERAGCTLEFPASFDLRKSIVRFKVRADIAATLSIQVSDSNNWAMHPSEAQPLPVSRGWEEILVTPELLPPGIDPRKIMRVNLVFGKTNGKTPFSAYIKEITLLAKQ